MTDLAQLEIRIKSLEVQVAEQRLRRLKQAGQEVDASNKQLQKGFRTLTGFLSRHVESILGISAAYGGLAVIRRAVDDTKAFGRQMAAISTIVDTTTVDMGRLRQGVLDLAKAHGAGTAEVAAGLYEAISSDVDAATESLGFLDVASRLATAGLANQADTVRVLAAVMNAYGRTVDGVEKDADILFQTVNFGVVTVEELASSLGQAVPFAAQLGVSFEELNAAIAAITLGGSTASQAVTQVRAAMVALLRQSEKLDKLFRERLGRGFSVSEVAARGLVQVLHDVRRATNGNEDELQRLLGRVEAVSGVLQLTGNQADDFTRILGQLEDSTGSVDQAFRKITEESGSQLDSALNKLRITMGEVFGPTVLDVVLKVIDGIERIKAAVDELNGSLEKRSAARFLAEAVVASEAKTSANQFDLPGLRDVREDLRRGVGGLDTDRLSNAGLREVIRQQSEIALALRKARDELREYETLFEVAQRNAAHHVDGAKREFDELFPIVHNLRLEIGLYERALSTLRPRREQQSTVAGNRPPDTPIVDPDFMVAQMQQLVKANESAVAQMSILHQRGRALLELGTRASSQIGKSLFGDTSEDLEEAANNALELRQLILQVRTASAATDSERLNVALEALDLEEEIARVRAKSLGAGFFTLVRISEEFNKQRDALRDTSGSAQEINRALAELQFTAAATDEERVNAQIQQRKIEHQDMLVTLTALGATDEQLAQATALFNQEVQNLHLTARLALTDLDEFSDTVADNISRAAEDALLNVRSTKEAIQQIEESLAREVVGELVIEPLRDQLRNALFGLLEGTQLGTQIGALHSSQLTPTLTTHVTRLDQVLQGHVAGVRGAVAGNDAGSAVGAVGAASGGGGDGGNSFLSTLGPYLPLAVGAFQEGSYIDQMTLGLLHPGERVLNAKENKMYEQEHDQPRSTQVVHNNTFNIQTKDADSFRLSQPQIVQRQLRALGGG